MNAKKRTITGNSDSVTDSVTIFALLLPFNNIFMHSYASFGMQRRKMYRLLLLLLLKYTFVCVNTQVIDTILKINRDTNI